MKIEQTSRAIIFEEFNSEKESLANILNATDADEVGETEFPREVAKSLAVKSFSEFMDKFAPKIYEIKTEGKIFYTIDAEEAKQYGVDIEHQGKDIRENTYYQMLNDLYVQKGDSKKANLEFDDKKFLAMLSPGQEVDNAKSIRKELDYVMKKYYEATKEGKDARSYVSKIKNYRRKIIKNYQESIVGLLPLAIEDGKNRIKALQRGLPQASEQDSKVKALPSGQMSFDGDGNIKFITVQSTVQNVEQKNDTTNSEYLQALTSGVKKDFDNYAPVALKESGFAKQLVVSTYAPLSLADEGVGLTAEERQEKIIAYKERINTYEEIYNAAKQSFIDELSKIIEKILGVEVFFDHAAAGGAQAGTLEQPVLIANCHPSALVNSSCKDKFRKYIEAIGGSETERKCWFALLPAVYTEDMLANEEASSGTVEDPFADIMDSPIDSTGNEEEGDNKYLDAVTAGQMLDILNKNRILTIFNLKGKKETSFAKFSKKKLEDMQREFSKIDYPHAVLAYPNFTLMEDRMPTDTNPFRLPGIYIDATYPAAGLLVASQQHSSLKARGFKVDKDLNCVRINLEDEGMALHFATNFNRENLYHWSTELKDAITSEMFGFAFCGDDHWENGKHLENTYVLCARTMAKSKKGKYYKPIYYVLMEDFIATYIKLIGEKYSVINKDLIKGEVAKWKRLAQKDEEKDKEDQIVNKMLHLDENITWSSDGDKKIVIQLKEGDEILQDIKIMSEEKSDDDKR